MRYAGIIYGSEVNGPGRRNVLFVQGCSLQCPGCCNRALWPKSGGRTATPEQVRDLLLQKPCDGVTISGGEPLDQAEELLRLLGLLSIPVILFTGYIIEEVQSNRTRLRCVMCCEAAILGRYSPKYPCSVGLRGSSNQKIWVPPEGKYTQSELLEFPHGVEVYPDFITGFPKGAV